MSLSSVRRLFTPNNHSWSKNGLLRSVLTRSFSTNSNNDATSSSAATTTPVHQRSGSFTSHTTSPAPPPPPSALPQAKAKNRRPNFVMLQQKHVRLNINCCILFMCENDLTHLPRLSIRIDIFCSFSVTSLYVGCS
jgi:hypothetical protein